MRKLLALAILATAALCTAVRAETTECMEITAVPAVITKQDLGTAVTSGNAIEIQTNNVTVDMNGYKLGGLAAGASTDTRGFAEAIMIENSGGDSSGHLIEGVRADGNRTPSASRCSETVWRYATT